MCVCACFKAFAGTFSQVGSGLMFCWSIYHFLRFILRSSIVYQLELDAINTLAPCSLGRALRIVYIKPFEYTATLAVLQDFI